MVNLFLLPLPKALDFRSGVQQFLRSKNLLAY